MIVPENDNIAVEIEVNKYGIAGDKDDQSGSETGIVAAIPDSIWYVGFHSFAFEDSFNNSEANFQIRQRFEKLLGRRVYWTQFQERGSILKDPETGKTYAMLKLTDIIASDDADSKPANSVKTRQGGSIGLN